MNDLFVAVITRATMALASAAMRLTVQSLVALDVALQVILLTALHHFLAAAAAALARHRRLARRTRARMTQLRARMHARVRLAAAVATAVRHVASIVLRILQFATEAIVLVRHLLRYVLAGAAAPALFRLRTGRPLDDALQVDDVIAVRARPNRLEWLDHLAAHQTLQAARIDLANQFFALRTIRCVHFGPLRWTLVAAIRLKFVDFLGRRLSVLLIFALF